MSFLEKNLEDIIYSVDNEKLRERGLPIKGTVLRQVRLGNYGIADLITIERDTDYHRMQNGEVVDECTSLHITIYELKKGIIDKHVFIQALKYAKGVARYIDVMQEREVERFLRICSYDISIVLVGSYLSNDSFIYLTDVIPEFITFCTYDYGFNGISFKCESGYQLVKEGF
jgi:hypothetical protein